MVEYTELKKLRFGFYTKKKSDCVARVLSGANYVGGSYGESVLFLFSTPLLSSHVSCIR